MIKKRIGGGGGGGGGGGESFRVCMGTRVCVCTCDDGERGVESERWMFLLRLLLLHVTPLHVHRVCPLSRANRLFPPAG